MQFWGRAEFGGNDIGELAHPDQQELLGRVPTQQRGELAKGCRGEHSPPRAELMVKLIESLSVGVPRPPVEIAKLGRTLSKRAADVLAYFDRPGTSNGPTEAINGRLEHLRGSVLGFRNLTNYIARSLLETGGFRPRLHPALVKSRSSWGSAKDTTETGNQ